MTKCIVSVVLGSYNRRRILPETIESVRKELVSIPHEIIVVDGGSTDSSLKWLLKQKDIITIVQHNRGVWRGRQLKRRSWGYFMNLGFKAAQGKYICMISDDCLIVPGAIKKGVALFEKKLRAKKKIGALAFYWRDWPVEKFYAVYAYVAGNIYVNHGLYLNTALQKVNYLDEDTYKFYAGDIDVCLKLQKAGYKIEAAENSYVEHYTHADFWARFKNNQSRSADRLALIKKWSFKYGKSEKNYERQTIKKNYRDPYDTVRQFYWLRLSNISEHIIWVLKFFRNLFVKRS